VSANRFDALVVGAGPAGAVAALVLARGGARVALVDKAAFPRDKACGDLIGPRGVRVLDELGTTTAGRRVADMEVLGPTGRRVLLRARAGLDYPGFGLAVTRRHFDSVLHTAALEAGAHGFTGRAGAPRFAADGQLEGFRLEGGTCEGLDVAADVIVGADGALSRVGARGPCLLAVVAPLTPDRVLGTGPVGGLSGVRMAVPGDGDGCQCRPRYRNPG
jgi:flavin-dependent dehydrogenase